MTPSRLVWARFPLNRCPECQAPVRHLEVNLALHFTEQTVSFDLDVAYCANSDTVFADLVLVENALDEVGFDLNEVEDFSIDDEPVEAGFWMGETIGAVPWEVHQQALAASSAWREQEAPDPEEVRQLPQEEETWFIAQAPGGYYLDDGGTPTLSYLALVVSEQELVRGMNMHEEALDTPELVDLVLAACARSPQGLSPVRPARVVLEDPELAEALNGELARLGLGITVEAGEVGPAQAALRAAKEAMEPEPIPTYFIHYPESQVKDFFKAAKRFFRVMPWEVVDGNKFLAFRLEEGPWHYANVMGQAGEEFGIAYFKDWLEVCKAANNPATMMDMLEAVASGEEPLPKSLQATGGAESVTLSPFEALAPEDAAYLKRLKIRPSWRKDYATVHRYTPYGMETPRLDITLYTGLMTVLAERAEKVSGRQISSLKDSTGTPKGQLHVRYPAKGDEDASGERYFMFRVPFGLGAQSKTPGELVWAEVRAPGEAKWHRVMTALSKKAKTVPHIFPWVNEVKQGDYALWLDQAPVKEPSPTVEQLAGQQGLSLRMGIDEQPGLTFTSLPRPDKAEITVEFKD